MLHRLPTLLFALVLLAIPPEVFAQTGPPGDDDAPTRILFDDLNQARSAVGLAPLAWDANLALAAQRHADLMASSGMLEHQLPGEAGLAQRCGAAGAHFSSIAENIASGGSLHGIHASWMHSQAHHDNILSPQLTVVGIGVARRGGTIYAVQDFALGVATETAESVERRVRDMLAIRQIKPAGNPDIARQACEAEKKGYKGPPSDALLVIHFTSPDLNKLGPLLDQKAPPGRYQKATVGACPDTSATGFTRYSVAVLFY